MVGMSATVGTAQADRFRMDGTPFGWVELDSTIFGIKPNLAVLHQVVTAQLAASRKGTHSTLTRSKVRGGGTKPFRQKGTGRARQGSTRDPQHRGGAVVHGPRPRDYSQRTPKKMIRLALNSSLSDRAANHRIKVVSAWEFVAPKTKDALSFLDTLGLTGNVLVVLDPDDITTKLSFRNIPKIRLLALGELTSYNVLRSDWVVFSDLTLPGLCVVHSAKANQDGDDGAEKMAEAARTGDDK